MTTRSKILYASEPTLDVAEFRRVLVESGLGETRPVDDETPLRTMLAHAGLVLTARRAGVPGRDIIFLGRQLGPSVAIALISVPDAVGFYERIGMKRMQDAFWFGRKG